MCKTLVLLACFLAVVGVSGRVYLEDGSPHVKLNEKAYMSGLLEYSREGRPFSCFLGIAYATFHSRFETSQVSTSAWDGVNSATKPGSVCMQIGFRGDSVGEEQCLTANIYVPLDNNTSSNQKEGYPVMVWIHGGGFMNGFGLGYGAKYFMDEPVILVTFNYRLGVFGFLSTGDTIVPGNNGMKDMVNMLKWLQQNIAQFGGNSGKVTIFGESAGSASVHYLLQSPLAQGLFHRAISQSGSALMLSDPNPRGTAVELATYLKCPTEASEATKIKSQEILSCLKSASVDKLNKAQFGFRQSYPPNIRSFFFVPTPEPQESPGAFITEYPMKILVDKSRAVREVPWMMGATQDEGGTMYAAVLAKNLELLEQLNGDWYKFAPLYFDYARYPLTSDQFQAVSKKIREFYFGPETEPIKLEKHRDNLTNLYSDEFVLYSVYKAALETVARGNVNAPVYLYQYAYPGPVSVMGLIFGLTGQETKKVCHSDDIQPLFDLSEELVPGASQAIQINSSDETFSKNMVRLWASFANYGEPQHLWGAQTDLGSVETVKWKPLLQKDFDGKLGEMKWWKLDSQPGYVQVPCKERMQFWENLYQDYFIPFYTKVPYKQ